MKSYISKLYLLLLPFYLILASCNKEGTDYNDLLGIGGDAIFQPIDSLRAESGYGIAKIKWTLPKLNSSLFYIKVDYKTDKEHSLIISRNTDSLLVDYLDEGNYRFIITSFGPEGHQKSDTISTHVRDWRMEPPTEIIAPTGTAVNNTINFEWKNPNHRTYSGVVVKLYQETPQRVFLDSIVVLENKPSLVVFEKLNYLTNYSVEYYSFSERQQISKVNSVPVVIGSKAPDVPAIIHDKSRIDHAYNAEIRWTSTEGMDSLKVQYTGLDKQLVTYMFGSGGYGYLSLLPGGKVELTVSVKGNNTWSYPQKVVITTKYPKNTYIFRKGNAAVGQSGNKLEENFAVAVGNSSGTNKNYPYPFENLLKVSEFNMQYQVIWVDEMEMFVNIQKFTIGGSYMPTPGFTGGNPDLNQFINLVQRLPKLTTLTVYKGYVIYNQIKQEFSNKAKYPKLQLLEK